MKLSDFNFDLPGGLIATRPVRPRPAARMLVVEAIGEGERLRVTAVRFEGNQAYTRTQLKREINTKDNEISDLFAKLGEPV